MDTPARANYSGATLHANKWQNGSAGHAPRRRSIFILPVVSPLHQPSHRWGDQALSAGHLYARENRRANSLIISACHASTLLGVAGGRRRRVRDYSLPGRGKDRRGRAVSFI